MKNGRKKIIKIAVVTLLLASIIVPVNTTVAYTQEDIVWDYKPPLTSSQGESLQIGDYVYHCLNEGSRIVKINADTGAEVDYIQNFTEPSKLVASSDGEFLYIATNENPDGSVGKIDVSTFGVAPTEGVVWEKNGILGTQAIDIDIDDNDEWLYVADYVNQTVNKINASTGDEAGGNFPVSYGTRTRTSVYYNGSIYVGLKDTDGVAKLNPDGTKNETDFPYTTGIQDDITNIVVNETERYLYVGTLGNEYHVITENATQIHENDCNGKVTDIRLDNENGVVYHSTDNDNTNLICEKQSDWSEVFNIEVSKANTGTTFISLSTNLTYIYCNNETGNLSAVYTGYASESEAETDPVNSNPSPSNGATNQNLNPTLTITINDPNGNTMNQTFLTNASGSWIEIGWNNDSANGTVSNTTSVFSSYNTKYWWNSSVEDGHGNWDNDTYYFTTMNEPTWHDWSDTWSISETHSYKTPGYLYGNWSHSEQLDDGTIDESWSYANSSHWSIVDHSSWWTGNYTLESNTSLFNSSFAVLENSGGNRSQYLGYVHSNDTETERVLPFVIYAYNTSQDFDAVMWTNTESYLVTWNGTNMTNTLTGTPIVNPLTDATDQQDGQYFQESYLTLEGHYYKIIYNNFTGHVQFKYWSPFMQEHDGWAIDTTNDILKQTNPTSYGIGVWNNNEVETTLQFDLINKWQLNYTVNNSAWINISGNNVSRPHMNFPVIDVGSWSDETWEYLNNTYNGNITIDTMRSFMKDNITNLMNLESRAFNSTEDSIGYQNDTVYYYTCMIDNYTSYNSESDFDEFLHIHVQMCPEERIDTDEYTDLYVGIDVDNDREWDANDRLYWAYYSESTDAQYNYTYNGNGEIKENIAGFNIWISEDNAIGNLHRYEGYLNYAINIPLADLVTSGGNNLNVSDVFGLSIMTSTAGNPSGNFAVWQNWNETSGLTYYDEETAYYSTVENFTGYIEEGESGFSDDTFINWGEGVISDSFTASETIDYEVTIEKHANISSVIGEVEYALINYTIWINNTGSGDLTNVVVNDTRFNCTCHNFNETEFLDSNLTLANLTNYSCYREFALGTLDVGSSYKLWYTVNITNCTGVTYGILQNNATVNATELSSSREYNNQITWGRIVTSLSVSYLVDNPINVDDVANSIFGIIGILLIIGTILTLVVVVKRFGQ